MYRSFWVIIYLREVYPPHPAQNNHSQSHRQHDSRNECFVMCVFCSTLINFYISYFSSIPHETMETWNKQSYTNRRRKLSKYSRRIVEDIKDASACEVESSLHLCRWTSPSQRGVRVALLVVDGPKGARKKESTSNNDQDR